MPLSPRKDGVKATIKKAKKKLRKVKNVVTRCYPNTIVSLIHQLKLQEDKTKAIKYMGFGWVFDLKCTRVNRPLCTFLLSKFDEKIGCLSIGGSSVTLSPADVTYVLGLSCSGADVKIWGDKAAQKEMYVEYFGSGGGVPVPVLVDQLLQYGPVDDGFKVRFMLLVLGAFLCPITSTTPEFKLIGCFKDVSKFSSLNWAKFAFVYLLSSIKKHKQKKLVGVGGCLLFLQLAFYERFCLPCKDPVLCKVVAPRLSYWGNKQISNRNRQHKRGGGFDAVEVATVFDDSSVGGKQTSSIPVVNVGYDRGPVVECDLTDLQEQVKLAVTAFATGFQTMFEATLETMMQKMLDQMNKDVNIEVKRVFSDRGLANCIDEAHDEGNQPSGSRKEDEISESKHAKQIPNNFTASLPLQKFTTEQDDTVKELVNLESEDSKQITTRFFSAYSPSTSPVSDPRKKIKVEARGSTSGSTKVVELLEAKTSKHTSTNFSLTSPCTKMHLRGTEERRYVPSQISPLLSLPAKKTVREKYSRIKLPMKKEKKNAGVEVAEIRF